MRDHIDIYRLVNAESLIYIVHFCFCNARVPLSGLSTMAVR